MLGVVWFVFYFILFYYINSSIVLEVGFEELLYISVLVFFFLSLYQGVVHQEVVDLLIFKTH